MIGRTLNISIAQFCCNFLYTSVRTQCASSVRHLSSCFPDRRVLWLPFGLRSLRSLPYPRCFPCLCRRAAAGRKISTTHGRSTAFRLPLLPAVTTSLKSVYSGFTSGKNRASGGIKGCCGGVTFDGCRFTCHKPPSLRTIGG